MDRKGWFTLPVVKLAYLTNNLRRQVHNPSEGYREWSECAVTLTIYITHDPGLVGPMRDTGKDTYSLWHRTQLAKRSHTAVDRTYQERGIYHQATRTIFISDGLSTTTRNELNSTATTTTSEITTRYRSPGSPSRAPASPSPYLHSPRTLYTRSHPYYPTHSSPRV